MSCTTAPCFGGTTTLSKRYHHTLQSIVLCAAGNRYADNRCLEAYSYLCKVHLVYTVQSATLFYGGTVALECRDSVWFPRKTPPPEPLPLSSYTLGRGQGFRLQQVARRCCGPRRGNQDQHTGTKKYMDLYRYCSRTVLATGTVSKGSSVVLNSTNNLSGNVV